MIRKRLAIPSSPTITGSITLGSNAENAIISSTAAGTATSSVAAVTIQPGNTLDANDLVLQVKDAAGTSLFKVDYEGDATVATITSTGNQTVAGGTLAMTSTSANTITSATSAATMSSSVAALTVKPTATPDANDLIFAVRNAAGGALLTVDAEGDVVCTGTLSETGTLSVTGNAVVSNAIISQNSDIWAQAGGVYSAGRLRLGTYYIWVNSGGKLYIKDGEPANDTDGTVVGTQS